MIAPKRQKLFAQRAGKSGLNSKRSRVPVATPASQAGHPTKAGKRFLKAGGSQRFPIVGIGASAGGLEAFSQLLKNLPVDTGMAFVLVQHLDPDHESALTQLLARTTSMPVTEVIHGTSVCPNHVYVIPRNTCMEIAGGVLKLRPREKAPGGHRSIDVFFESLAQDLREWAIGVILSGTATDGTRGLEMIKAEGGFTFAQDDSAKFDSMPRSAIAAGCVDRVLGPKGIAIELARIANHPFIAERLTQPSIQVSPSKTSGHGKAASETSREESGPPITLEEQGFKKILQLLRTHRGVDFSLYKPNTIQRRITRRMVLNKQNGLDGYAQFLKGNLKELDLLYSDVLISVTSFFRNPDAFEALKLKVFPQLLHERAQDDPVRAWTLGCSTGQEAYSIAMAFTEFCDNIPRPPQLQIFATDLNEALLEKARHGLYSRSQIADVSPGRLKRFFTEEQGGFRVCKGMREICVFARQNVLSDPPFSRMDLISCRNMLIYIETELQKRILPNFHYALKPGGFLLLGASESVGAFPNLFAPADKKQKIFSKKPGSTLRYHLPVSHDAPADKRGNVAAKPLASSDSFAAELNAQREADRIIANHYAPPSVLINSDFEALQFRGSTKSFLEPPAGKASFNVLKMACGGLMLPLRAAINEAKKKEQLVQRKNVRLDGKGPERRVNFEVFPLKNLKERCYLIVFEEVSKAGRPGRPSLSEAPIESRNVTSKSPTSGESRRLAELERELAESRDYAQSLQEQHEAATEELQSSSEEVQSGNEELQSINEELETSKEEIESTNEELTTVNEELASRNTELNSLNSDLINLQTSTKLPIVLLGRDLTIRRFSPQAEKQFNLVATDMGRPFGKVRHDLDLPDLEAFVSEVIDSVRERECEVRDKQGRWHLLHVRPYLTLDNKVDGAVLVLMDINAIKESERSVIAARDFAEAIIRTARDPFLILDANLRVERANEAFYSTFKVSREESLGRTVFELDHGHWDIPKLRELLEDILPRHSFFNAFEVTHDFENIGRRTMLLNARTLSETNGQHARILLGIQDISELLHFQAQMRRSELRYRRLFEAGKDGVLIIDPRTRKILDANPFMTDLLGYPHQALLGKELFEIGLLKDEAASRTAFEELQRNGFIRYENLPLETQSGQRRDVEFVSNLYHEGGEKIIQCNIRDVTKRKHAERELSEKARLLDLSNDAIIVRDLNAKITLWNKGAERLFGWTFEEIKGKNLHALLHTEFPNGMEGVAAHLHSETPFSGELIQTARDGRRVPCLSRWVLDPGTESILTSYTDITDRKKTEEELRHAHALLADRADQLEHAVAERTAKLQETIGELEAFSYSVTHDMRAPLRAMQSFALILAQDCSNQVSAEGRNYIRRIQMAAERMDRLILDVLTYSQIVRSDLPLTVVNVKRLLDGILESYPHLQPRDAEIVLEGNFPEVRANEAALMQCISNLIGNAVKFVDPETKPKVQVWAETEGTLVRLFFRDNGIGIGRESHEKIFEIFQRLSPKYEGTGIGLSIVKKAIERVGGRVGLESEPGRGSTFYLELQRATAETNDV
jgi:two-component system CheB/CheR fusion protein